MALVRLNYRLGPDLTRERPDRGTMILTLSREIATAGAVFSLPDHRLLIYRRSLPDKKIRDRI